MTGNRQTNNTMDICRRILNMVQRYSTFVSARPEPANNETIHILYMFVYYLMQE